jgi:hypothetical protein
VSRPLYIPHHAKFTLRCRCWHHRCYTDACWQGGIPKASARLLAPAAFATRADLYVPNQGVGSHMNVGSGQGNSGAGGQPLAPEEAAWAGVALNTQPPTPPADVQTDVAPDLSTQGPHSEQTAWDTPWPSASVDSECDGDKPGPLQQDEWYQNVPGNRPAASPEAPFPLPCARVPDAVTSLQATPSPSHHTPHEVRLGPAQHAPAHAPGDALAAFFEGLALDITPPNQAPPDPDPSLSSPWCQRTDTQHYWSSLPTETLTRARRAPKEVIPPDLFPDLLPFVIRIYSPTAHLRTTPHVSHPLTLRVDEHLLVAQPRHALAAVLTTSGRWTRARIMPLLCRLTKAQFWTNIAVIIEHVLETHPQALLQPELSHSSPLLQLLTAWAQHQDVAGSVVAIVRAEAEREKRPTRNILYVGLQAAAVAGDGAGAQWLLSALRSAGHHADVVAYGSVISAYGKVRALHKESRCMRFLGCWSITWSLFGKPCSAALACGSCLTLYLAPLFFAHLYIALPAHGLTKARPLNTADLPPSFRFAAAARQVVRGSASAGCHACSLPEALRDGVNVGLWSLPTCAH